MSRAYLAVFRGNYCVSLDPDAIFAYCLAQTMRSVGTAPYSVWIKKQLFYFFNIIKNLIGAKCRMGSPSKAKFEILFLHPSTATCCSHATGSRQHKLGLAIIMWFQLHANYVGHTSRFYLSSQENIPFMTAITTWVCNFFLRCKKHHSKMTDIGRNFAWRR